MTIITTTATFCSSKHGRSQTHRSRVVTRTPNPPPSSAKNHHYYDYQLSFLSIWKLFADVYWWSSIAKETFGFLSLFEQLWLEVILSSNCITIYDVDQYSTFDVYLMQYAVGVQYVSTLYWVSRSTEQPKTLLRSPQRDLGRPWPPHSSLAPLTTQSKV